MIFFIWIVLSFFAAFAGEGKKVGYWGAFLWSILLSPLIGLIIGLISAPKEEPKKETINVADELKKLGALKEKGTITEEEFEKQKAKLL